jgi:hypothetical protein
MQQGFFLLLLFDHFVSYGPAAARSETISRITAGYSVLSVFLFFLV